jgi:hypothetical protein
MIFAHAIEDRRRERKSERHDGETAPVKVQQRRIRSWHASDEHALDASRVQDVDEPFRRHALFMQPEIFDEVTRPARAFDRAGMEIGEVRSRRPPSIARRMSRHVSEHGVRDRNLPPSRAHPGGEQIIHPIAELLRGLFHSFTCLLRDAWIAVEDPRRRGLVHSGQLGDSCERHGFHRHRSLANVRAMLKSGQDDDLAAITAVLVEHGPRGLLGG